MARRPRRFFDEVPSSLQQLLLSGHFSSGRRRSFLGSSPTEGEDRSWQRKKLMVQMAWSLDLAYVVLTCFVPGYTSEFSYRQTVAIIFGSSEEDLAERVGEEVDAETGQQTPYGRLISFYRAFKLCARDSTSCVISVELLKSWHAALIPGGGVIRTSDVVVGWNRSYRPCIKLAERLSAKVDELNRQLQAARGNELLVIKAAGDFVYEMEMIHPFLDGNGRVGHLSLFFILSQVMKLPTFLWTSRNGDTINRMDFNWYFESGSAYMLTAALEAGVCHGRENGLEGVPFSLDPVITRLYNVRLQYSMAFKKCIRAFDILDPFLTLPLSRLVLFNEEMLGQIMSSSLMLKDLSRLGKLNKVLDSNKLQVVELLAALSEAFMEWKIEPLFGRGNCETLVLLLDFVIRRVVPVTSSVTAYVSLEELGNEDDGVKIQDRLGEFVVNAWSSWKPDETPIAVKSTAAPQLLDFLGLEGAPFMNLYVRGDRGCMGSGFYSIDSVSYDGNSWFPFVVFTE